MMGLVDLANLVPHAKYKLGRSNGSQDIAWKRVTLRK
jgi:hypothetical protein